MKTPHAPERIRLTITVTPEVHETFTRMAAAGSMSLSRAMGDWLADTVEAAAHMATLMERARSAPREVTREMHAYALGLADETGAVMEELRVKSAARATAGAVAYGAARVAAFAPPSGNTGGKVPSEKRKEGGRKR
jgi:hypothetical protein